MGAIEQLGIRSQQVARFTVQNCSRDHRRAADGGGWVDCSDFRRQSSVRSQSLALKLYLNLARCLLMSRLHERSSLKSTNPYLSISHEVLLVFDHRSTNSDDPVKGSVVYGSSDRTAKPIKGYRLNFAVPTNVRSSETPFHCY